MRRSPPWSHVDPSLDACYRFLGELELEAILSNSIIEYPGMTDRSCGASLISKKFALANLSSLG